MHAKFISVYYIVSVKEAILGHSPPLSCKQHHITVLQGYGMQLVVPTVCVVQTPVCSVECQCKVHYCYHGGGHSLTNPP